ncbi:hypothetical protein MHYP_G00092430 [Metynnis hypsauchen]
MGHVMGQRKLPLVHLRWAVCYMFRVRFALKEHQKKITSVFRGADIPEKGQLQFQGNRIHIYPDFSADVARRRAAFTAVKPKLREASIEYGLLFPARLRINHNGVKHVFESPQQVTVFLQWLSLSPDANVQ